MQHNVRGRLQPLRNMKRKRSPLLCKVFAAGGASKRVTAGDDLHDQTGGYRKVDLSMSHMMKDCCKIAGDDLHHQTS